MADVKIAGGHVTIARSSNDIVAQNLSASMEELQLSQTNDVIIHCKNGEKLRTNKLPMVIGSKFIRSMFAGNESCCCCATSDLILSDFSIESVIKVTNFLHTGRTFINARDETVRNEFRSLIEILEIDVDAVADPELAEDRIGTPADAAISKTRNRPNPDSLQSSSNTTSPTSMTAVVKSRLPSLSECSDTGDNVNEQFSCQFCGADFDEFPDLSKHVRRHFLELEAEGKDQAEKRPRVNCSVKIELEDQSDSGPQIVSVQSFEASAKALHDFGQLPLDWNDSDNSLTAESSPIALPSSPVEKKPRLIATIPQKAYPSRKGSSGGTKSRGQGGSAACQPKAKCMICRVDISDTRIQIVRHLAISHFARNLQDEFGPSKASCPQCRKPLKTRRGFLAHMLIQHSKLPKTFAALQEAIVENKIDLSGATIGGKKLWMTMAERFSVKTSLDKATCLKTYKKIRNHEF